MAVSVLDAQSVRLRRVLGLYVYIQKSGGRYRTHADVVALGKLATPYSCGCHLGRMPEARGDRWGVNAADEGGQLERPMLQLGCAFVAAAWRLTAAAERRQLEHSALPLLTDCFPASA